MYVRLIGKGEKQESSSQVGKHSRTQSTQHFREPETVNYSYIKKLIHKLGAKLLLLSTSNTHPQAIGLLNGINSFILCLSFLSSQPSKRFEKRYKHPACVSAKSYTRNAICAC